MKTSVSITGLNEIEAALISAGPKLARNALRRGLVAAGKVMVDAVKSRVPVDSGDLKRSIKARVSVSPKKGSGSVKIGPAYGGKGSKDPGVYGRFQEFGTIHDPAQPFMRPAFDAESKKSLDVFTDVMREEVQKLGTK